MISSGEIETVVCAMPDLWGRLLGKRLTGQTFLRSALTEEGLHGSLYVFVVDIDMDPKPGYALTHWADGFRDCRYVPDLSTLRVVPWLEKTAIVICDPYYEESDEPVAIGPRNILKRQVAAAKAEGLTIKAASELEFFTYRNSYEEAWDNEYRELSPTSRYRGDYHIFQSTKDEPFIGRVRRMLDAFDIEVEFSKTEWGLGQQEVNLRYAETLEMADRHALYKLAIKEMTAQEGMCATFMAKVAASEIGSSCHVHTSLWDEKGDKSLSWDEGGPGHMSETFGRFVAGLLETAADLTLLSAPNINSYKRLVPDSFAPSRIALGDDNRTCAFRLCGHKDSLRVENRIPGADVNPYLAFASQIAGGLHGLRTKMPAPAVYDGNAYHDESLTRVPHTLHAAIDAFAGSAVGREALGDEVTDHLLTWARQELHAFESEAVTDWERVRYFERV
jgi:glutamine synthetase